MDQALQETQSSNKDNQPDKSQTRVYLPSVWAGLGVSHSGDLFVVGAHNLSARLLSLEDEESSIRYANINVNGFKFGAGLGGSISAVFVLAHGYDDPQEMIGVSGGRDFDLAIGAKLSDFLRGVRGLGRVIDTMEKYRNLTYLTENAMKNLGVDIYEPGIITLPIPFAGAGLHAWLGYQFGNVSVSRVGQWTG